MYNLFDWFMNNKHTRFCLGLFCSIGGIFILFIIGNSLLRGDSIDPNKEYGPKSNYHVPHKHNDIDCKLECDTHLFVPTVNDMMVLDTIESQVVDIEKDIDTLHIRINRIEDKIDALIIEQDNE